MAFVVTKRSTYTMLKSFQQSRALRKLICKPILRCPVNSETELEQNVVFFYFIKQFFMYKDIASQPQLTSGKVLIYAINKICLSFSTWHSILYNFFFQFSFIKICFLQKHKALEFVLRQRSISYSKIQGAVSRPLALSSSKRKEMLEKID